MPVTEMLERMPYDELLGWFQYFSKRPIGWREDNRAYRIMQAFGTKEPPDKIFESFAKIKAVKDAIPEEVQLAQNLKNSGMLARLMGIASKNNVDWKIDDQIQSGNPAEAGTSNPD